MRYTPTKQPRYMLPLFSIEPFYSSVLSLLFFTISPFSLVADFHYKTPFIACFIRFFMVDYKKEVYKPQ